MSRGKVTSQSQLRPHESGANFTCGLDNQLANLRLTPASSFHETSILHLHLIIRMPYVVTNTKQPAIRPGYSVQVSRITIPEQI